ncbi:hypothetical protein B0I37DRAFT_363556 [Chaetomium sp. MPI-CAGE-AT-0009]|nr:hypothetical protein B0I37DRAFT_363556 [Chaetomium sp. MPI-CAGE-AT-0009]
MCLPCGMCRCCLLLSSTYSPTLFSSRQWNPFIRPNTQETGKVKQDGFLLPDLAVLRPGTEEAARCHRGIPRGCAQLPQGREGLHHAVRLPALRRRAVLSMFVCLTRHSYHASRIIGTGVLTKGGSVMLDDQPTDEYTIMITLAFKSYDDVLYYQNTDPVHHKLRERIAQIGLTKRPFVLTSTGVDDDKK